VTVQDFDLRAWSAAAKDLGRGARDAEDPVGGRGPHGEAVRRAVEDRFAWHKVAQEVIEVYSWLLSGGSRSACVEVPA
jgi:hypothetical protein